ncbi:MAG: metalloregulator ArsR/SmtB family transcription factor [Nanoarchaeota archaeon]
MINKNILKQCRNEGFSKKELYESYKLFFGTLISEPRLKIINLLRKDKKNVSQIVKELKMDQTIVSHNLSRLKKCGFVKSEIDNKYRYYSLNKDTIKPLMEIIEKHMSLYCIRIIKTMKGGKNGR